MIGVSPGPWHVVARWAVWRHGGVLIPIFERAPAHQLIDQIERTETALIIADERHTTLKQVAGQCGTDIISIDPNIPSSNSSLEPVPVNDDDLAQLLFTSGTTGRAKIVCQSHGNLKAQIATLTGSWSISSHDHILHCLPLHHIHGIVNALECPLWNGAAVTFLDRFEADSVWRHLCCDQTVTIFMGVPAMYAKLIEAYERVSLEKQLPKNLSENRWMVRGKRNAEMLAAGCG
jgi:malonyl-CoA/methylmalonyl-CoA synthetase